MANIRPSSRIGVFGGSFDPPHIGHLVIAELALEQLRLDRVIFVPAFMPPHKINGTSAAPAHRVNMLKLAVRGNPAFAVSLVEFRRKGVSYTVDTLREIQELYPEAELFLIVGSDNEVQFESWKSPEEITLLATLAVYERKGESTGTGTRISRTPVIRLKGGLIDFSSTSIRLRMLEGKSVRYLVPQVVEQYIKKHRLYHRELSRKLGW